MRWIWDKASEGIVQGAAWALVVFAAYLLWDRVRQDVVLPLWVLFLAAGVPATIAIGQTIRRYRDRTDAAESLAEQMNHVFQDMRAMQERLAENQAIGYYANHLYEILTMLRRSLAGTIPGVDNLAFLEHGVLQPARDLLRRDPDEDVRLSILFPDNTGKEWRMRYAAGHSLESRQAFRLPIEMSFSRLAYEESDLVWSNNLSQDARFIRHPQAREGRGYESMISVPIRRGDQAVAVLNVISSEADAFGDADLTYAKLIGAVAELVLTRPGATGTALPGGEGS